MGTPVFLVLLAIVWIGVGVYWFRTRTPATPSLSIGSYSRRLSVLDSIGRPADSSRAQMSATNIVALPGSTNRPVVQTPQAPAPGGVSSAKARVRRRNVLVALVAASVLSLGAVLLVGGTTAMLVHLALDAVLLAFVLALVQYQREVELQRTLQRPVYAPARQPTPLAATGTDGAVGFDTLTR